MKRLGSKCNTRNVAIAIGLLIVMIGLNAGSTIANSGSPPTQNQVFVDQRTGIGHNFTENYWDIMVHNNSKWEVSDPSKHIKNNTTWLNNTWNISVRLKFDLTSFNVIGRPDKASQAIGVPCAV